MAYILVADDEFLLAMILSDVLEDEGYEVATVSNGEAALSSVYKRRPDLVITDFMMPAMTGLEFAEAIRSDKTLASLPIILVSGAQGAIARQRPELFQAVLDKPYRINHMLEIVEQHLSRQND